MLAHAATGDLAVFIAARQRSSSRPPNNGSLRAVAAVQVPRVRGAALPSARLVVGRAGARARAVGELLLPGDDAAFDVAPPAAPAGAVDVVCAAHHLVVRPAVA